MRSQTLFLSAVWLATSPGCSATAARTEHAAAAIEQAPCSRPASEPYEVSIVCIRSGRITLSTGIPLDTDTVLMAKHAAEDVFEHSTLEQVFLDKKSVQVELLAWGDDNDRSAGDWAVIRIRGYHNPEEAGPLNFSKLRTFTGDPKDLREGSELTVTGYTFNEVGPGDSVGTIFSKIKRRVIKATVVRREKSVHGDSPRVIYVLTPPPHEDYGLSGGPVMLSVDGDTLWAGIMMRLDEVNLELGVLGKKVFSVPMGERRRVVLPSSALVSILKEQIGEFPALN